MPPGLASASIRSTSCPRVTARCAAASPIGPAPSTTMRLTPALLKLQNGVAELGVEIGLGQRRAQRRRSHPEDTRPVDDRKNLGDDQRLELADRERRVPIE